jgi:hypothetical protein
MSQEGHLREVAPLAGNGSGNELIYSLPIAYEIEAFM